jgi:hypothetical protein
VDATGDAPLAAPVKVRADQSLENRLATLNVKNRANRTQVSAGSQGRPLARRKLPLDRPELVRFEGVLSAPASW